MKNATKMIDDLCCSRCVILDTYTEVLKCVNYYNYELDTKSKHKLSPNPIYIAFKTIIFSFISKYPPLTSKTRL